MKRSQVSRHFPAFSQSRTQSSGAFWSTGEPGETMDAIFPETSGSSLSADARNKNRTERSSHDGGMKVLP